ncbi:hypothetical protein AKJ39_01790 [candidate division MSBL1 archaeon SCGC-AAA259J03]|uniref:Uncharacterized protein n=1 Tax=candidate division MSBL1 archaeon SCGC-AAA259J03 TaxID=1698269 RepID=A0A656YWG5_9EURY|nr:hypothetical protein AKJ39_01790 [candidate division MSBL1 archaeon SCGC-AAA259J03]
MDSVAFWVGKRRSLIKERDEKPRETPETLLHRVSKAEGLAQSGGESRRNHGTRGKTRFRPAPSSTPTISPPYQKVRRGEES